MKKEQRKQIKWYSNYEISNLWNIKNISKDRTLKKTKKSNWYYVVTLMKDWKYKLIYLHRIIAKTFITNPYNKRCINHKDWDKLNNEISNIEWCTYSENQKHRYSILWHKWAKWMLGRLWVKSPYSKKTWQYTLDWKFIKLWYCTRDIERELWFAHTNISACCRWIIKKSHNFIWKYI